MNFYSCLNSFSFYISLHPSALYTDFKARGRTESLKLFRSQGQTTICPSIAPAQGAAPCLAAAFPWETFPLICLLLGAPSCRDVQCSV